eukprot:gene3000-3817_t
MVGVWEIMWKEGGGDGPLCRLTLEANLAGYTYIRNVVESWSVAATMPPVAESSAPDAPMSPKRSLQRKDTSIPMDASIVSGPINCNCTSQAALRFSLCLLQLVNDEELRALTGSVPARFRQQQWKLLYSTWRDGISLHTLFRHANARAPTLLVIGDSKGFVFGTYSSESWRSSPRYYGTGESFVFQIKPRLVKYAWAKSNTYFQYGATESLAVGGGGAFSLWLDEDLRHGNSGWCDTFNSPCLASDEEFTCRSVELWSLD